MADKEINVGPLGASHVRYWKNEEAHKIIARKLAEDCEDERKGKLIEKYFK